MVGSSKQGGPHGSLDPGQYTSLALTHVQYHPGDPLSMPLSLITLAPPFLLVSYITLLLVRRELTILTSFIGQLGCEGFNLALKRIFKQGRPTDFLGTGYGMPSSHSQFMGYFMAFWCIHLFRFRPGLTRARRAKEKGERSPASLVGILRSLEHLAAIVFVIALSVVTAYSRYHLSYHTPQQIFVGFSVGLATGALWYFIVEILFSKPIFGMRYSLRQIALNNPISIAFRVRDSWAVWDDGGIEGEYGFWRQEWKRLLAEEQSKSTSDTDDSIHTVHLLQALQLANKCDETTAAFSVGCVITLSKSGEILSTGYSRQEPGNTHAEEVALNKLIIDYPKSSSSSGTLELDLYTTMEPCSERLSKKSPCVQRILEFNQKKLAREGKSMKIVRIFQGVQEPDDFVKCVGTQLLESKGLKVATIQGSTKMKNTKTSEEIEVQPGWIEREAIRLAKKGHADQKVTEGMEARMWTEQGWAPSAVLRQSNKEGRGSENGLRRRGR